MTFTWVGGASTNWGDAGNWEIDGSSTTYPPSSDSIVDIDSDNNPTIALDPGSNNGYVYSGTVNITGSGTVTFDGGATNSQNFGDINIDSDATLKLDNGVDLQTNKGKGVSGGTVIITGASTRKSHRRVVHRVRL